MKILTPLRKRGLALFLVLTMCMNLLPATALAAELEIPQDVSVEAEIPAEVQALLDAVSGMETAHAAFLASTGGKTDVTQEEFEAEYAAMMAASDTVMEAYDALPPEYAKDPQVEEALTSYQTIVEVWTGEISLLNILPEETVVVTLEFKDGDTVVSTQKLQSGDDVQIPAMPAKDHQVFEKWDGLEQYITDGKLVIPAEITANTTVTITAKYTDVWYVTFDDGSRVVDVANVVKGSSLTVDQVNAANEKLQLPAGQSLVGWTVSRGSTDTVPLPMNVAGDVTLYPVTEEGVWVTFDSQEGSYVEPRQVVNGQVTAPADPTREGYTFAGWFTAAEGGTQVTFPYSAAADTTLYARWTGNQVNYTVIYWKENADWENPYLDRSDWDKEQYSYMDSETKTGTAGTAPVVSAGKAPQGFKAGTTDTRVIAGDGSTIVNVYYDRETYKVKFYKWQGGLIFGDWKEQTQYTIEAKHGANIRRG